MELSLKTVLLFLQINNKRLALRYKAHNFIMYQNHSAQMAGAALTKTLAIAHQTLCKHRITTTVTQRRAKVA